MKNLLVIAAFTAAGTAAAVAQRPGFAPQENAAAYSGNLEVSGSYSGSSAMRLGTAQIGDIDSRRTRIEYVGAFKPGADVSWSIGVAYTRWDFGRPAGAPLPADLHSITLPLGGRWKIDGRWSVFGELTPGFYTDFVDVRSEDFNAPFIGGVGYAFGPDLQIFFVASVDGRRDVPFVGGPGVRWRFADRWTIMLTLPRPQIQYRAGELWTLHVGGEIVGGAYHLNRNFGTGRGMPSLDNQIVNYREIRAGAGARWGRPDGLGVSIDAGWMIDRRFVLDDIRTQFNGAGALYGQLSLNYRY
jgi:hypothetical protein